MPDRKSQDRRRSINPVKKERRGNRERRRECPQCGSPLLCDLQRTQNYHQQTLVCTSSACSYTAVHRMVPFGKIGLNGSYEVTLIKSGMTLALELPLELCHFAKLEKGQRFILKTLQPLRWNIEKH